MSGSVIRLKPFYYIHVLDNNANVTTVETGPQTFTVMDHQTVVQKETPMIIIPPRHYCIISNPAQRDSQGHVRRDVHGQVKLRHGDEEIRFEQEPFPLYPGEQLFGKVSPLQVVAPLTALKLRAIRDFVDPKTEVSYSAGDEWLFPGPGTYVPTVEVTVVEVVRATIVGPNQALRLRAKKEFVDSHGVKRQTGEEWIVREEGAYIAGVFEEIAQTVSAVILTEKKALHLRASRTFHDVYGVERKAGEEWLVTSAHAAKHIPDVYEIVVGEVSITTLNSRQYCVILDPFDQKAKKQQLGTRVLVTGPASFFLQPGERLEAGIQDVQVLDTEEALLLRAREGFEEKTKEGVTHRAPGDRWMIYGPRDYVPSVEVEIIEKRRAIPLDANEGIYVRDMKTGRVTAVTGKVYRLSPYEELWDKELPASVEELLQSDADQSSGIKQTVGGARKKSNVVTYRIPHNSAVQIYDYKAKKARVIFGPELIMLGPDEQFTVLSLSGNTPKTPKILSVIALLLGPRFSTDVVIVETSDHARLSLKLSYNWHFEFDKANQDAAAALFSVPDFIGDFCKAIASRVRGNIASQSFDHFHKHSADIIRKAVFGTDEAGNVRNRFHFKSNNLIITNIDIQSVEPVDQRTRDALQKSVQLAIEITTKSQEAAARHEAERREQEAKGRLERQKIDDEAEAEKARRELLSLQATSAAVESTGQAAAEAKARAAAAKIEGTAAVAQAQYKAEAQATKSNAQLKVLKSEQEGEITHKRDWNQLEIKKAQELAEIDAGKFKAIIDAVGSDTLRKISQAGPEMQSRLLAGLGLKSFLVTDGNHPINLFNTAIGLIGANNPQ
jgi:major vault protein